MVETDCLDAPRPRGVLTTQILVELQHGPPLQHLRGRDVTLREPPGRDELPQEFRVGLVGLGPLLSACATAVSAGSARCTITPALAISSAT